MATMTLDDYRPMKYQKDETPVSTTTVADDDTAPTNWETARTVTFPAVTPGDWTLSVINKWSASSVGRRAMFRVIVNGVAGDIIAIEPKDRREIHLEDWFDIVTISAESDFVVETQFLLSSGNGTASLDIFKSIVVVHKVGD